MAVFIGIRETNGGVHRIQPVAQLPDIGHAVVGPAQGCGSGIPEIFSRPVPFRERVAGASGVAVSEEGIGGVDTEKVHNDIGNARASGIGEFIERQIAWHSGGGSLEEFEECVSEIVIRIKPRPPCQPVIKAVRLVEILLIAGRPCGRFSVSVSRIPFSFSVALRPEGAHHGTYHEEGVKNCSESKWKGRTD
ncbi:hypothetical protein [Verrucomicrobium sp. BvORR034]|uniref:hypothetical protein n=1 Tax=Verrucomicrobium sp. BvORR034 TaxID=1396418 RepID=UPI002240FE40|nr:hypothetical protein [Verrucomicrobium sp. BvORR034]